MPHCVPSRIMQSTHSAGSHTELSGRYKVGRVSQGTSWTGTTILALAIFHTPSSARVLVMAAPRCAGPLRKTSYCLLFSGGYHVKGCIELLSSCPVENTPDLTHSAFSYRGARLRSLTLCVLGFVSRKVNPIQLKTKI